MRDKKTHLVAGVAAIGAAVAIGAGVVYATSSEGSPAPAGLDSALSASTELDQSIRSTLLATLQETGDSPGDAALDTLAENLGITRDALDAALQQTALDLVDDALAEGRIDEDRASDLRERIESGEPFGLFGHGFGNFFGGGPFERGIFIGGDRMTDRVQSLVDEGIIEQATADAIIAAIAAADGPIRLDDLVEDGVITQEALDSIREAFPFGGRGPRFHRFGGFPFGGPFGGEEEESDDSSSDGESSFEA
jgi:hypothetical protein